MTREEEIMQAAFEYINSDAVSAGNEYLAYGDFVNGVKWADKHQECPWKKVKKVLPEEGMEIIIRHINGDILDNIVVSKGDISFMQNSSVTEFWYWMVLPELPKV